MATIGNTLAVNTRTKLDGYVIAHNYSGHHYTAGASEEVFELLIYAGSADNTGSTVTLGIYDITSGIEGATLVGSTDIVGDSSTDVWRTATLGTPIPLTNGNTYCVGAYFNGNWSGRVESTWRSSSVKQNTLQTSLIDPFASTSTNAYANSFYASTRTTTAPSLTAEAGSFVITGGTATINAPTLSEGANAWWNSEWWRDPFFGPTWWTASSTSFPLSGEAGTIVITGGTATLFATGADVTLTAEAGSFVITGGEGKPSVPFIATAGAFLITGGTATFQIEFSSEEFIISNDTTFDGKGISHGIDIAYNETTGEGFTVIARVDVDSLFLDGVFGVAPQTYQILEYVGEVTIPSKVVVEFTGEKWQVVSQTPLGL